jgi:hypothetical protein
VRSPKTILLTAFLLAIGAFVPTVAQAEKSLDFCVEAIETHVSNCFGTEQELTAFQDAAALTPLATMYRDINYTGGYRSYVSAYGRNTCDAPSTPREASSGDLRLDKFSNGIVMDKQISSFTIKTGSYCFVYLYTRPQFQGERFVRSSSCVNLLTCTPGYSYNDAASSLGIS